MEKWGEPSYEPNLFNGFRKYSASKDIINAIENVILYIKLKHNFYYFEHNDYESDYQSGESYSIERIGYEPVKVTKIHAEWVLVGLDNIQDRTSDDNDTDSDLVIGVDVFENGKAKLRIHYPSDFMEDFYNHYSQYNDSQSKSNSRMFISFDESKYHSFIEDIMMVM